MSPLAPRTLLLVKHSLPEIVPELPAREWVLSDAGRARCLPLARRIEPCRPALLISSGEPKAVETAAIVARELGVPAEVAEDLHEHDRTGLTWHSPEAFRAAVARLFERPGELVLGRETADQAHERFSCAVQRLLNAHSRESLAIVAHGTVIALLVSRACGMEPFPLWLRLGLPSFVLLSLPEMTLLVVADCVETASRPAAGGGILPPNRGGSARGNCV